MNNRIRKLREEARLSQAEIATLLHVDEASVSRWEGGSRPLSPAVIEKLAKIFKIPSWQLFFDRKGLRHLTSRSADSSKGVLA